MLQWSLSEPWYLCQAIEGSLWKNQPEISKEDHDIANKTVTPHNKTLNQNDIFHRFVYAATINIRAIGYLHHHSPIALPDLKNINNACTTCSGFSC